MNNQTKKLLILVFFCSITVLGATEQIKDKCWITNQAEIKCKNRSYASTGTGPVKCSLTSQGEILCQSIMPTLQPKKYSGVEK